LQYVTLQILHIKRLYINHSWPRQTGRSFHSLKTRIESSRLRENGNREQSHRQKRYMLLEHIFSEDLPTTQQHFTLTRALHPPFCSWPRSIRFYRASFVRLLPRHGGSPSVYRNRCDRSKSSIETEPICACIESIVPARVYRLILSILFVIYEAKHDSEAEWHLSRYSLSIQHGNYLN